MKAPVEVKMQKNTRSTATDKEMFLKVLQQGWRNPGCEVTWATKFCMAAPKFVGPQYELG
jgi:hypothetical protein